MREILDEEIKSVNKTLFKNVVTEFSWRRNYVLVEENMNVFQFSCSIHTLDLNFTLEK